MYNITPRKQFPKQFLTGQPGTQVQTDDKTSEIISNFSQIQGLKTNGSIAKECKNYIKTRD